MTFAAEEPGQILSQDARGEKHPLASVSTLSMHDIFL
jgi:hypothetical protein